MHKLLKLTCISYAATISTASDSTSYYKICSLKNVRTVQLTHENRTSKNIFTPNFASNNNSTDDKLIEGRMCPCAPKYYCLIDDGSNVCGITHDNEVACFYITSNLALVRNVWVSQILSFKMLSSNS